MLRQTPSLLQLESTAGHVSFTTYIYLIIMVVSKSTYLLQSCVHINLIVALIDIGNLKVS